MYTYIHRNAEGHTNAQAHIHHESQTEEISINIYHIYIAGRWLQPIRKTFDCRQFRESSPGRKPKKVSQQPCLPKNPKKVPQPLPSACLRTRAKTPGTLLRLRMNVRAERAKTLLERLMKTRAWRIPWVSTAGGVGTLDEARAGGVHGRGLVDAHGDLMMVDDGS